MAGQRLNTKTAPRKTKPPTTPPGLVDSLGFTLRIETDEGVHDVAIDFDFSTLGPADIKRANELGAGGDGNVVTLAFLFVKVAQEIDLDDSAWPGFRDGLMPAFEGDGSIVEWINEEE